jgi:UDP-N-acetylmuramate dehydrogenase
VGGAVRGNAGCFGGEMKDAVVAVRSFDIAAEKFVVRTASACRFGYRESIFKKKEHRKRGGEIVTQVTLRLARGDAKKIARAVREKIAYRTARQPLDYPNIGSIFKNVPLEALYAKTSPRYRAAVKKGEVIVRGVRCSVKRDPFPVIPAARLIAESDLRGVSMGGAMVSVKHPNFIVNTLGADVWDVAVLVRLVKEVVRRRFGIRLEEEVQVVYNEYHEHHHQKNA